MKMLITLGQAVIINFVMTLLPLVDSLVFRTASYSESHTNQFFEIHEGENLFPIFNLNLFKFLYDLEKGILFCKPIPMQTKNPIKNQLFRCSATRKQAFEIFTVEAVLQQNLLEPEFYNKLWYFL